MPTSHVQAMSVTTTSDVVISDVVIVATTAKPPQSTSVTAAKASSVSACQTQLKFKVDESGIGLVRQQLPSEVIKPHNGCCTKAATTC